MKRSKDSAPPSDFDKWTIEEWPLEKIIPYAGNARKIPPSAVAKVAASLKAFGWQWPILVEPDGVILAGHTRREAAAYLEWKTAQVRVVRDLTPAQAKLFRITDNRTAAESSWQDELLKIELEALRDEDLDLSLTGFDAAELDKIMSNSSAALDDDLMDPSDGGNKRGLEASDWLKWSNKQIPLTAEELAGLNKALDDYIDREGVNYGFTRFLLGMRNDD